MKSIGIVFACLGVILGFAVATLAHAENSLSFVSGNGSGSACTFSAPCFDFNSAISATASGGLVTCVDQGANSEGFSEGSIVSPRV